MAQASTIEWTALRPEHRRGARSKYTARAMIESVLLYTGLAVAFAGLVSLALPLRFLRIRTRRTAMIVFLAGMLLAIVTLALPVREKRVAHTATALDRFMPVWQFDERHTIHVDAPPERVFEAIRGVRACDIRLFRTLTTIRRFGRPGPESILNAPADQPILDVATRTSFVLLADEAPRELVIGTVVIAPRPRAAAPNQITEDLFTKPLRPGVALATMNFLVTPDDGRGSIVSTETRVFANSKPAERRFAIYWRFIRPGSDIIRRMWLRAIARRAEVREPKLAAPAP